MTLPEIEQLEDDKLDYMAFQCICGSFPSGSVPDAASVQVLPAGQQMLLLTSLLEVEVMNGGFNQYFYNRGEAFASLTLAGYHLLQAHNCAALFGASLEVYHSERAQMLAVKAQGTLQAFSDSYQTTNLTNYDTDFYRAVESEGVEARRAAYIRQHLQDEFSLLLTPQSAAVVEAYQAMMARCNVA